MASKLKPQTNLKCRIGLTQEDFYKAEEGEKLLLRSVVNILLRKKIINRKELDAEVNLLYKEIAKFVKEHETEIRAEIDRDILRKSYIG